MNERRSKPKTSVDKQPAGGSTPPGFSPPNLSGGATVEHAFLAKLVLFFQSPGSDYLQGIRRENKVQFFGVGAILNFFVVAFISAYIGVFISTDQIEMSPLSGISQNPESINSTIYLFWTIDILTAVTLWIYSLLFWVTYRKYVAVFLPKVLEYQRINVLRSWAKFCIYAPQFICLAMVVTPLIGGVHYYVFVAGGLAFVCAALFARALSSHISAEVGRISTDLDPNTSRYNRLRLIDDMNVFPQIFVGWITLNIVWAIVICALGFTHYVLSTLYVDISQGQTALGPAETVVRNFVYASFGLVASISLVGAMRLYGKLVDRRYLNSAEVLNREFSASNDDDDDYGAWAEEIISSMSQYYLEVDATVGKQPGNPARRSLILVVDGYIKTSRAIYSLLFSVLICVISVDFLFGVWVFLALIFSYTLNDLIDFLTGKDAVCHPHRPLPSGQISAAHSAFLLIILALVIFMGSNFVATVPSSASALLIGGAIYTCILKYRIPVVATPFWCALIAFVFYEASGAGLVVSFAIWFVIFGRELLLDLRDAETDFVAMGKQNLGRLLGDRTVHVSLAMFGMASLLLFYAIGPLVALYTLLMGCVSVFAFLRASEKFGAAMGSRVFSLVTHALWPATLLAI